MPIFFSVMLVPLWKGLRPALPWAVAGCGALVAQALAPGYVFILAGALALSASFRTGGRSALIKTPCCSAARRGRVLGGGTIQTRGSTMTSVAQRQELLQSRGQRHGLMQSER